MSMTYPRAGDFLVPGVGAPVELQDKLLFVFFASPTQGVMAWDITTIDDDILFPVMVKRYHLEILSDHLPVTNRDLLDAGPATLQPGRERDFFVLYDTPQAIDPGTESINRYFAYAPLTHNTMHVRLLEELRLTRFLLLRGFMGFDCEPFQQQLDENWWRIIPADPEIVFALPPDARLAAARQRARLN
jgi:putative AlgH/UPF0301 family transcriptional regulator